MHKVYSIKKKKYSKKYFVNFVDFTQDALELSLDIISEYNITKDKELDDNAIDNLINEQHKKDAKIVAYNYVSYKPRSEFEVKKKLEFRGFDSHSIDFALKFLYEFNLLDDREYAKTFIINYLKRNPSGEYRLEKELQKRGISEELISTTLDEYYPSEKTLELAKIAAQKHSKKISHKPKLKQKRLISDYLARRGFDWEIIKKIINEM